MREGVKEVMEKEEEDKERREEVLGVMNVY